MPIRGRAFSAVALAVLVALVESCGGGATAPGTGKLSVAMTMSGNDPDPNGAAVSVDGDAPQSIFAGQSLDMGTMETGSHVITLSGLASNCQVNGANPRVVSVTADTSVTVIFDVACSTPTDGGSALLDYLMGIGPYVEGQSMADTVTEGTSLEAGSDATWTCTTRHVSAEDYPDDYATFNPNAEVIYPGSMLQGATLADATPEPVVVPRAGGTVVINLLNGSSGVSRHVDEVKQSTIVQAINDILASNTDVTAGSFTFTSTQVQSQQQMAASLGVNVSTFSTQFSSSLSFSQDKQYNRFLVKFTQSYYTVSFDLPLSLGDLFAPSVTDSDLAPYVGPDNPPTYISSVTYGRTFFLLIESTASVDSMRASIKASYDAAVVDGSITAGATYVKDLKDVNIKVFALGGDQSLAAANFNGDLSALGNFLTHGGAITTGVPLSYVVRNVVDNRIVNVKVATDYDIKACVPNNALRLYTSFDAAGNTEGWVSYDNGSGQVVQIANCVNDPVVSDSTNGCAKQGLHSGTMQFRAPSTWTGNTSWLPYYGGTIRYLLKSEGGDYIIEDQWGPIIVGTAGEIYAILPVEVAKEAHAQGWTWVTYTIDENGTTFGNLPPNGTTRVVPWMNGDGTVATADQIKAVLANVTDFRIVGELYTSHTYPYYTYLDEISVNQPDSGVVGGGM